MKNIFYSVLLMGLSTSLCFGGLAHKSSKGYTVGSKSWDTVVVLEEAAKKGDPVAMYVYGWAHDEGDEIKEDDKKAREWYQKAAPGLVKLANDGNVEAMVIVGESFEEGNGVAKNKATAAQWYQKASDKGNTDAMYLLGKLYEDGEGVPKDKEKAKALFTTAAEKGHPQSRKALYDKD